MAGIAGAIAGAVTFAATGSIHLSFAVGGAVSGAILGGWDGGFTGALKGAGIGFVMGATMGTGIDIFGANFAFAAITLSAAYAGTAGGLEGLADFAGGMVGGAYGSVIGSSISTAFTGKPLVHNPRQYYQEGADVYIKTQSGKVYNEKVLSAGQLKNLMKFLQLKGEKIAVLEYHGHGFSDGSGLVFGDKESSLTVGKFFSNDIDIYGMSDLMQNVFAPNAEIQLQACYSAYGNNSIAHAFKEILPEATVKGYTGSVRPLIGWSEVIHDPLSLFGPNRTRSVILK